MERFGCRCKWLSLHSAKMERSLSSSLWCCILVLKQHGEQLCAHRLCGAVGLHPALLCFAVALCTTNAQVPTGCSQPELHFLSAALGWKWFCTNTACFSVSVGVKPTVSSLHHQCTPQAEQLSLINEPHGIFYFIYLL